MNKNGVDETTEQLVSQTAELHPEAENFLHNFYAARDRYHKAEQELIIKEQQIAVLNDQLDGAANAVKELSDKADYYMRLNVELRTHFMAAMAIFNEADKCFRSGPYRDNGIAKPQQQSTQPPENRIQDVADAMHKIMGEDDQEPPPKFLTARKEEGWK